jgi:hypothetical protein
VDGWPQQAIPALTAVGFKAVLDEALVVPRRPLSEIRVMQFVGLLGGYLDATSDLDEARGGSSGGGRAHALLLAALLLRHAGARADLAYRGGLSSEATQRASSLPDAFAVVLHQAVSSGGPSGMAAAAQFCGDAALMRGVAGFVQRCCEVGAWALRQPRGRPCGRAASQTGGGCGAACLAPEQPAPLLAVWCQPFGNAAAQVHAAAAAAAAEYQAAAARRL